MYSDLKTAIKTHLESITGIKNVYGYEKGNLDGYPSAILTCEAIEIEPESNCADERKYTFKVKVLQEMDEDGVGAEEAEGRIEALIDTLIGKFEDDYTLGGLAHNVNIRGIIGYIDRGPNMRVIELTLDVFALYTLT